MCMWDIVGVNQGYTLFNCIKFITVLNKIKYIILHLYNVFV